jgi:hypothetical protein
MCTGSANACRRVSAPSWVLTEIKESLHTTDLAEAKLRWEERNLHYERLWRDHLDGPKPTSLTQMQAAALAGELYREVVAAHQQNPGRPDDWETSSAMRRTGSW